MQTPFQLSLLRRTLATVTVATAGLMSFSLAQAQGTVTLSGASGNSCSYSAMSVAPNGSVIVTCSGGGEQPPPPPIDPNVPGAFRMAAGTMNASANSTAQVNVSRTGGGLATTIYFWRSGDGCDGTIGALNFAANQMSASIPTPVKTQGSTCTVSLSVSDPATLADPNNTVISVTQGTTPGPGPGPVVPPGCPAAPAEMLTASFAGPGNPLLQMQKSGQVVAIKVPNMNGRATGQVAFGESAGGAYTPQPVTLEISINRCPGVIETDYANQCNLRSTNGNYNSITWLTKTYGTINSSNSNVYGLCWAGEPSTEYYINARWSYQSCAFGAQVCGFAIQYNDGGY